ncbi:acylphosphatase [Halobacteriovorax sp. BALOs_7]|uniref:acylphosphatase n=1 Tax=Halobacteriovorax sp. BALOs_7 TaxID=2109558 RepID=UPI000EA03F5D|nr:acylphosphatase [Halobacteriovorax sp. BALOs_7]AYF44546.1 acylphosphatase [Halobacteriovorax sp. BALOs_7]
MINRRYRIEGKVQGVFFRKSTLEYVNHHTPNITGYVKNLKDGSVEVLACGDLEDINNLEAFLKEGPETAEVEKVTLIEQPSVANFKDFQVG